MSEVLYSVRMRASRQGAHISGAERIVRLSDIDRIASELAARALGHERGVPDTVSVKVDSLAGRKLIKQSPLPVRSIELPDTASAHEAAVAELTRAGVSDEAARRALGLIMAGASPDGGNMRGAMIIDASSGERLEQDRERGVRARAVDYDECFLTELTAGLKARALDRTHLKEALAVATKVAHAHGAVAELCVSDDPSYVTGYVASSNRGYVRITPMKERGCLMGGRVFFVDGNGLDMDAYLNYMRETPVLIKGTIKFA